MSTAPVELTLEAALSSVPTIFRNRLIEAYRDLKAAYTNGPHDACGLRAGKLCEVLLRYLQQYLIGSHTPFGQKIGNFEQECTKVEQAPKEAGPEGLRVIVPRGLLFLYTLRNKRGIGHVGGDVDANEIDAATMVRVADWCLCELVRTVHLLSLEEAQAILDAITERQLPEVWSVGGRRRVLVPSLDYRTQTLRLLYGETDTAVPAEDLFAWTEYSGFSDYRRNILRPLHAERLIEFDQETNTVVLSPTGVVSVETDRLAANGRGPAQSARRAHSRRGPDRKPARSRS
jgi:hypothetical protein